MSEDEQALDAAKLYADDATFADIAEQLGISKSHAQHLVRIGIALMQPEEDTPGEFTKENPGPGGDQGGRHNPGPGEMPSLSFPQDSRTGVYMLETTGIGRRILLTPKALMIYDLWCGAGFQGDLSDFIEDSINFLYNSKRPTERFG